MQSIKYITKYKSAFNGAIYSLDSTYELNFALYLDDLYKKGIIVGWVKNTTKFQFSKKVAFKTKNGEKRHASFIPDFLVFFADGSYKIIETKGWIDSDRNTLLLRQSKADYAMLNFEVLGRKELRALQNKLKADHALPNGWISVK